MDKPAQTQFPIHELLKKRWSPRVFSPRAVPRETLMSLFEAARWSASSYNEQPWRFIVARREDAPEFQRMLECLVPANQAWAKGAPVLVIGVKKRDFTLNGHPNRVALHDLGAAAASLTFEATHRGLFVHQMAGIDQARCKQTYKIPDGFDAETALAIGHGVEEKDIPAEMKASETEARARKPFGEFVFGAEFGKPSALIG